MLFTEYCIPRGDLNCVAKEEKQYALNYICDMFAYETDYCPKDEYQIRNDDLINRRLKSQRFPIFLGVPHGESGGMRR